MSTFRVFSRTHSFNTNGEIEFIDLSGTVQEVVTKSGVSNGLVHVFAPHATGILVLAENDYALLDDLRKFIETLVPRNAGYEHPSNAHAHLRSVLLPPDRTLPVLDAKVQFGTWQSLIFVETDVYPRRRTVIIQVIGEE
jgi:secondary thiamine-phosphate synthase enzyme